MLLGNFYKYSVDNQEEGAINATVKINSNHAIFNGHFPEFPVVPGVCQVLMVREIISEVLQLNLQLNTAKSIKFLSILNPNEHSTIQANILYNKIDNNQYKINATLFLEGQNYLKLRGEFCERK